ncbi:MAG: hypothetical protein HY671_11610 [Chloroflexi bacterium]|nr:hypothetical protein [Chloroflexota bacterium]
MLFAEAARRRPSRTCAFRSTQIPNCRQQIPDAARLFVNWLPDEEGQTLYNSLQATAPVTRIVVSTPEDYGETARLMQERFLAGIWKQ